MKRLALIRHAKSSWKDASLADHDRPLAKRGKRDAPEMARRFAEGGFAPELVVSSSAKRARKTAKHVIGALERSEIFVDERIYMASSGDLLAYLRAFDDGKTAVAIVGHNPGLTDFCELLSGAGISNIPTSGVVQLELDVDRWSDAAAGCAKVVDFDYPKKLAAEMVSTG